jgi:hypothetical protein
MKMKIHRTTILFVVLYGCEIWSVTLTEERRLRVFENKVLRSTFGPKTREGTGERRRLHNEELYVLYSSPNISWVSKSRKMRWAGNVARMGDSRGTYRVLVWRPERKSTIGRPSRRWEDNFKINLQEVGWGMDWIDMVQNRVRWWALVNAVMNLRVPLNAGNFLPSRRPVSFSRRTVLHGVS